MAASDNLSSQFGGDEIGGDEIGGDLQEIGGDSHKEVISGIEDMHGVGFTGRGLQYGNDGRIVPISMVSANSAEEDDGPYHTMRFEVPTEDRGASNSVILTNKIGSDYGIPTGVSTSQLHDYPDDKTVYRSDVHEDVPSAMEHLDRTAKDRAEHLANKTVPPTNTRPGEQVDIGVWGTTINNTGYQSRPIVPPNIIQYYPHGWKSYKVDASTRERIQDKDR
jgi:hypothetical protein